MRWLLLTAALGGCTCYDTAYDAFCADTGRCERGPRLSIAVTDVEVGVCGSGVVTFRDEKGDAAPAGAAGTLALDGGPDVDLFIGVDCSSAPGPFTFTADQSTVAFRYMAPAWFGPQQLSAAALGLTGRAGFLSTATLRFVEKRHAVVNDGGCAAGDELTLQAFAPAVASGVASRQRVELRLSGGVGLDVGVESGMCMFAAEGFELPLSAGDSQLSLYAQSRRSPGEVSPLTAAVLTAGSGLLGSAAIDVHTLCYRTDTSCDAGSTCCSGVCLAAGTCQ